MTEYNCDWQAFGSRIYSQHGEDIIVLNIFQRMWLPKPSYLDLGAHHPFHISNTALLYERGSRGINVEPNPQLFEFFPVLRPEDRNLCCGVGPTTGTFSFYMHHPMSGRNSFVRKIVEEQGPVTKVDLPVYTVAEIVTIHANSIFPDFLSLDVEGLDYEVLQSIDYSTTFPKIICVEMFSGNQGQHNRTSDIKALLSNNYAMHFQAGANGIFVHRSCKDR